MQNHGDRNPTPKSLSEILLETDPNYGEQGDDTFNGAEYQAQQPWPDDGAAIAHEDALAQQAAALSQLRAHSIAIAAQSFGAGGTDTFNLLARSEEILNYIVNGLKK